MSVHLNPIIVHQLESESVNEEASTLRRLLACLCSYEAEYSRGTTTSTRWMAVAVSRSYGIADWIHWQLTAVAIATDGHRDCEEIWAIDGRHETMS